LFPVPCPVKCNEGLGVVPATWEVEIWRFAVLRPAQAKINETSFQQQQKKARHGGKCLSSQLHRKQI
jgi:hypothetical protein